MISFIYAGFHVQPNETICAQLEILSGSLVCKNKVDTNKVVYCILYIWIYIWRVEHNFLHHFYISFLVYLKTTEILNSIVKLCVEGKMSRDPVFVKQLYLIDRFWPVEVSFICANPLHSTCPNLWSHLAYLFSQGGLSLEIAPTLWINFPSYLIKFQDENIL